MSGTGVELISRSIVLDAVSDMGGDGANRGTDDPMNTAAPAYAHGAGNATTLLSPTTTTQTEQMQSLSSRRSLGLRWRPKIDLQPL